jgi:hypothetical protein
VLLDYSDSAFEVTIGNKAATHKYQIYFGCSAHFTGVYQHSFIYDAIGVYQYSKLLYAFGSVCK